MKTIKPQRLGVLCRPVDTGTQNYFVVTALVFFPLRASKHLLSEVSLWKFAAIELGQEVPLDACMPKSRGELLITGRGYPRGGPRPACSVRARIGAVDKTLFVVGERRWKRGVPTEPEPFTEMPIAYGKAFGGEGYPQNPLGKGAVALRGDEGETHPLPNIEDPKHLITSPRDRPAPAGFGPYDLTWPQRFSKIGTYDREWLGTRFPGFAKDMDWGIFNTAPEDQQIEGYFRGDEAFSLENMHPEIPLLEGTLPAVAARIFVTLKTDAGEVFREIPTRLDTVHLFPHADRGILFFRGMTRVTEDDGADVVHLLAGCEAMSEPKPVEHYREVLTQRLDKERGYLLALRDRDLMPPPPEGPKPAITDETSEMAAVADTQRLLEKNLRKKAALEREKAALHLQSLGLDPADFNLPEIEEDPPPVDIDDLPAIVEKALSMAEQAKVDVATKKAEAEAEARKTCEENGLDYDVIMGDARKNAGGPPKFSAREELDKLRELATLHENAGTPFPELEAMLADPELEPRLVTGEQKLREVYQKFAHHFPEASALEGDAAARVRAEVIAAHAEGRSLAGRDLTGADLSGLDLEKASLKDALLERVNLSNTRLAGADLTNAVLARADLTGADLTGANLTGANLGLARLHGTKLEGASLKEAVLAKAEVLGAILRGANLEGVDLLEAKLTGTDLSGVNATRVNFIKTDLEGLVCQGADMSHSNFLETPMAGADFSGARLTAAVLLGVRGDGAIFAGANLENLRVVMESSFEGADFQKANVRGANLRGTRLARSDFSEADLDGADLSGCDLSGAKLCRALAREVRFIRSDLTGASLVSIDLMNGSLQKAKIHGADFQGANLFRVDFAGARTDGATSLKDANLNQIRVVAPRPHDQG